MFTDTPILQPITKGKPKTSPPPPPAATKPDAQNTTTKPCNPNEPPRRFNEEKRFNYGSYKGNNFDPNYQRNYRNRENTQFYQNNSKWNPNYNQNRSYRNNYSYQSNDFDKNFRNSNYRNNYKYQRTADFDNINKFADNTFSDSKYQRTVNFDNINKFTDNTYAEDESFPNCNSLKLTDKNSTDENNSSTHVSDCHNTNQINKSAPIIAKNNQKEKKPNEKIDKQITKTKSAVAAAVATPPKIVKESTKKKTANVKKTLKNKKPIAKTKENGAKAATKVKIKATQSEKTKKIARKSKDNTVPAQKKVKTKGVRVKAATQNLTNINSSDILRKEEIKDKHIVTDDCAITAVSIIQDLENSRNSAQKHILATDFHLSATTLIENFDSASSPTRKDLLEKSISVEDISSSLLNATTLETLPQTNSKEIATEITNISTALQLSSTHLENLEDSLEITATPEDSVIQQNQQLSTSLLPKQTEIAETFVPKISLIPISRLIASEFSEILLSNTNSDIPKSPRNVFKPNLIKRKRNISTCSNTSTSSLGAEHTIVDKLVTMNKMSLKNIINSTGTTKYDEALQMQARKRLREEIRRQLKSLNIEPPKEQINSDFVPDEIVDAMNLPDVVFDEIRKALGLDLLDCSEDMKSQNLIDFANNNSVFGVHNDVGTSANEKESNHCESADVVEVIPLEEPKKEDDKVRDLELTLEQELLEKRRAVEKAREKVTLIEKKMEERNKVSSTPDKKKKRKKLKKKKESRKTKDKKEIIVIDSSSSSSSGSDSDSSSGSSSGSCSSGSSTSSSSSSDSEAEVARKKAAAKRKGLKLKVDAENVVDSFEKLILPRLRESLIDRYRTKHADSTSSKLHFISCICTSEYNSSKFSKLEIAKIQRNIKSSDPSAALEFLMREIINVINKQKLAAKHAEDAAKEKQSPQKSLNDDNQRIAVERLPATVQSQNSMKSVNAAEKLYNSPSRRISKATTQNLQECVSKVLSLYRQEMKAAMQSMQEKNNTNHEAETARAEEQHQSNNKAATNHQQQQPLINANINGNEKNANAANVINATNVETQKQNPINSLINQQQQSQPEQQCKSSESNQHNNDGGKENECRLNISLENLRFSGGQKIINDTVKLNTSMAKDHGPVPSFDATTNINNILCLSASPYTGSCLPTTFPSVDLDVLRKQSIVGQAVADNLRDIDLKLFELNKRKMYLDEMILKLQKDKMEAELQTIKLQNEKFILLNTVMTANVSSEAIISKASSKVESIKNEEQTEIKRPKRESQKVCANNVKRPNMLITVRKHKLAIKRKLKVTAAEKNRMISAKKAKPACNQAESSTNTQAPDLAAAVSTATDKTAEKAIEEPCKTPSNTETNSKSTELQTAGNSSSDKTAKKSAKKHKRSHSKKSKNTNSTEKKKNNSEITTASETAATSSSGLPSSSSNPSTNNSSSSASTTTDNKPNHNHIKKSATVFDYSIMPAGNLEGFHSPITQIQVFENHIYASSECGQLYKFDIKTLKLINSFSKHKEAITQMYLCSEKKMIFTTSLDGYLKKSSLENFELDVHSLNLKEPLQSLDVQWGLAYIGSRWGNIYIYNVMTNSLSDKMLCASETSVIAIKAVKEGPRRVLIVSSKGNLIHLRDAATGLLLRTFDVPDTISIYSMLLHDGVLYCGTQRDDICKYDFVTGSRLGFMKCGNGAVNIKLYKNKFILVGCYDGFIYVLDVVTGEQVGCITGSGKMVLTLEVVDNKIITSAKDNSMKVIDIPKNFGKITVKD